MMGKKYTKKLQDALITNEFFGQSAENSCPFGCCKVHGHGHRAPVEKPNPFPTLDHEIVGAAALVCLVSKLGARLIVPWHGDIRAILGVKASKRMKTIRRKKDAFQKESHADSRAVNRNSIRSA
jgi:hypothetical protein